MNKFTTCMAVLSFSLALSGAAFAADAASDAASPDHATKPGHEVSAPVSKDKKVEAVVESTDGKKDASKTKPEAAAKSDTKPSTTVPVETKANDTKK